MRFPVVLNEEREQKKFIIDAHEDIAYNALEWGRDIRQSVYKTREREAQLSTGNGEGQPGFIAMSGLPELRRAGVGLVLGVIFAHRLDTSINVLQAGSQTYRNAEEAYRIGQGQLAYYRELAKEAGISLIHSQNELAHLLAAWEMAPEDDESRPLGIVPLLEGADPIRTPAEVAQWFADGIRIVGLAWRGTRYSGGTRAPGPLTLAGQELLQEMEHANLILDISHMAEESFWQALKQFNGPILASHSNCRVFTPSDRHLSDDMLKALIERDAVIGIMPVNTFLDGEWGRTKSFEIRLSHVVRHIDHICQLAGNARHVGIGSDIDGGFGLAETPVEMETVADLAKLADALQVAGYKDEDVAHIMGGNWQRFLAQALPL